MGVRCSIYTTFNICCKRVLIPFRCVCFLRGFFYKESFLILMYWRYCFSSLIVALNFGDKTFKGDIKSSQKDKIPDSAAEMPVKLQSKAVVCLSNSQDDALVQQQMGIFGVTLQKYPPPPPPPHTHTHIHTLFQAVHCWFWHRKSCRFKICMIPTWHHWAFSLIQDGVHDSHQKCWNLLNRQFWFKSELWYLFSNIIWTKESIFITKRPNIAIWGR